MVLNTRALVLLGILLSITLFLVGFRYGKYVEHADKTFVPPASPTPFVESSPTTKPFSVDTYTLCGISLLYPNYLEEQIASSQEANLVKNNEFVRINCDKKTIDELKKTYQTASPSAQTTSLYQNTKINLYQNGNTQSTLLRNPRTNQSIFVETTDNLAKLVLYSIEFMK